MSQWEIEARTRSGEIQLCYLVAPGDDVAETHKRLLRDDPMWMNARIRVAQERDPATEFWKRLKVRRLTAPSL